MERKDLKASKDLKALKEALELSHLKEELLKFILEQKGKEVLLKLVAAVPQEIKKDPTVPNVMSVLQGNG